jgi:predicted CopG family antitoxin
MHDKCMAVKTITIDLEAYELLRRRKRGRASFSQVIKEHFGSPRKGRDLLTAIEELALDSDTLEAIDDQIARRGDDSAEAPVL